MIHDGRVKGLPLVDYTDAKATVEALVGCEEGMTAYASDSDEFGAYDGSDWAWVDFAAVEAVFADQAANQAFFGPVSGAAAAPGFRAVVAADIQTVAGITWTQVHVFGANVGFNKAGPVTLSHWDFAGLANYTHATAAGSILLESNPNAGVGNFGAGIILGEAGGAVGVNRGASIYSIQTAADGNVIGIGFAVHGSPSGDPRYEAMRITHAGVGVNETAPGAQHHIQISGTTVIGQIVRMAASQTANPFEVQTSASATVAYISPTGGALFSDKVIFTQLDGNEAIDSLADGYMDYLATIAHRFNAPITVPSYERHIQIPALLSGNAANTPTPADFFTAGGLQWATVGTKYAFFQWEIPDDWDGTSIIVEVDWFADSGAMSGTDAIKWDIEYRAIAEGEAINNGASVTLTVTNTDDNAQYVTIHSPMTMAFDDGDQPLAVQDHIFFKVSRDTGVANDFSGTVTVPAFEIIYQSTTMPGN